MAAPTMDELVRRRAGDRRVAMWFEDRSWTWDEYLAETAARAALLARWLQPGPPHVGVLLDNVADYVFWLTATAVSGTVLVGLNHTRSAAELALDAATTDVQIVVTEPRHRHLLDDPAFPVAPDRILDVEAPAYRLELTVGLDAPLPTARPEPDDMYLLIFTSGTSAAPKAVRCSQSRIAIPSDAPAGDAGMRPDDVVYVSMPLFHSSAILAGWGRALGRGATMVLRRRFSASGFLPDVRRYGVTWFPYVGKPLSYVLATPEAPGDDATTLRVAAGNEAAELDIKRFATRFGCRVSDGFGSTEGGVVVLRTEDTPIGSLGRPGDGVAILDPDTGDECPPAIFDADGRLLNADDAVGELVNTKSTGMFAGYYGNTEADAQRVRRGTYWSGDLAYRDAGGFVYFAGRSSEWLRVDGENLAVAPIERILERHPDVVVAAVYAVPDPRVGDQVMAALVLRPGRSFDPDAFAAFLAAQHDLGTKSAPRFVRVADALTSTETNKVLKRALAREAWLVDDPVWWRPEPRAAGAWALLDDAGRASIATDFTAQGRSEQLETR